MKDTLKMYLWLFELFGARGLPAAIKIKVMNRNLLEMRRPGLEFPIFLRFPSSDLPTYFQVFVRDDYAFEVTKNPKIIVDAGANIGLASIYFSNKFPQAKI